MNKKTAGVMAVVAITGSMGASSAFASDGFINFTGKVIDSSCSVTLNGGDISLAVVTLPTVSAQSLNTTGSAGLTNFVMNLTGCPSTGAVRAFFEARVIDTTNGNLMNVAGSTAAANVQVQLANADTSEQIDLRTADQTSNPYVRLAADGTAALRYAVRYRTSGAGEAGAGDVAAHVTYSLEYQ